MRSSIRLLLGVSGPSGSGKTYSAMRLAKGLSRKKRFAVVDTENGRASMYADFFDFDVINLTAPFTSERYQTAILAAEAAGYEVIVVDSFSHEYEGDGGILDRQETELDQMVKQSIERGDTRKPWQLEEAHNMRAWNFAKQPHKKLVTKLLQLKAHVIFALRAEDKIEIIKKDGKTVIQPKQTLTGLDGYVPICEKRFPYELTASFLLTPDKPGVPKPIKLQEQHKAFFPLDKPITEDAGRLIGEWAKGSPASPAGAGGSTGDKGHVEPQDAGEKSAVEWFKEIEAAPSLEVLRELKPKILAVQFSAEDRQTAIALLTARHKVLTTPVKEEPWI